MATTETRPAAELPPPALRAAAARARLRGGAPGALGAALGVAVLYAAFAGGAVGLPAESRLQVGIAAIAMVAVAGLLFGRGLAARLPARARLGLGLLVAFAAWVGLSIAWSIAPDESWAQLNRAISYALVAGLGLVLGASLPRSAERVALGFLGIAAAVALYALAGKALPWIDGLDHAQRLARLHEPLGYWNALALFCAMAVPIALRAAAVARSELGRLLGLLALIPLLTATILTYSRGGIVVLAAALAVQLAVSRDRARLAAFAGAALLASAPAIVAGLALPELTKNGVPESARVDEGLAFLAALIAGTVAAVALFRPLSRASERLAARPARPPGRRLALAACLLGLTVLVAGAAVSEGGLAGQVRRQVRDVTQVRFDPQTPGRLLSTNSGNRWDWWREAIGAASDKPLTGYGAGSFRLVHLQYRKDGLEVRQPHNVPLQFLAETGVVGAALGLGGLGLLGLVASSGALARVETRERGFAIALLAASAAWGLHLFVDWDWDFPAVMLPALVFLGVLAATPRELPPQPSAWRARPSMSAGAIGFGVALLGACALLCVAIVSAVLPSLANDKANDALAASASRDRAELTKGAEDAAAADRLNSLSIAPLMTGAAIAESRGQYERAGRLLTEAARRQPDNPEPWLALGRIELGVDDGPAAARAALRALTIDRFNLAGEFLYVFARVDERRSASATGTPLPEKLPGVSAPPSPAQSPPAPQAPARQGPVYPTPPSNSAPQPQPQPPSAPAPRPQAPKQPAPKKFRSSG